MSNEVKANPDTKKEDVALGKKVRASVCSEKASFVTDGNPDTFWEGELYPRHLDVDLEENYKIEEVELISVKGKGYTYSVYLSMDGVNFDFYGDVETDEEHLSGTVKGALEGRVVRVLVTSAKAGARVPSALCEIKVYGEKTGTKVTKTRKEIEFTTYKEWLKTHHQVDLEALQDENGHVKMEKTYTKKDTVSALEGLVSRILGEKQVKNFHFEIEKEDTSENYFEVESKNSEVYIKADTGVSAARGLNHYLKYYCHVHVSQQTKQVSLPEILPETKEKIVKKSKCRVRYAYNYCTLSYTMPFYNYERWQRELDYLFLQGVNLILDPTGIDAVWVRYLQKLGFTADEAKDYIPGYCYSAWFLMGNLEGYLGPVADAFVKDTLELARTNERYMTVMGAEPCFETFVGAMPHDFAKISSELLKKKGFSDVAPYMAYQGLWAGGFTRPDVLRTDYDGYSYLAKLFYDTQKELLGEGSHYYCGDVCHEGGIVPKDLPKPEMSKKILKELLLADEKAVWMLQGWWSNPMREVLEGFGKDKKDHIMILDLAALAKPKWTDETTWGAVEFGSTMWVFCNLDNYGGRIGMHGKLKIMAEQMAEAQKKAKWMKGIGITPEGTNQNPVVFDLFFEMAWEEEAPDMDLWLQNYVRSRYGVKTEKAMEAWRHFERTVYGKESYDGTSKNNIITEDASLSFGYCSSAYYKIPYSRAEFEKGVSALMEDFSTLSSKECYIYDVVDVLRMALVIATDDYFDILKCALALKKEDVFKKYSALFLEGMNLVSEISSYNEDDLLGNWLGKGTDFLTDPKMGHYAQFDKDLMEMNGKALVTEWASSPITNYGNRMYNGLMEDFYIVMWKRLFENIEKKWEKGETPPEKLGDECFKIGWNVVLQKKKYRRKTANPQGDKEDRGLLSVYEDVKKHFLNEELANLKEELQKEAEELQIEKKKEEAATIATNIEH